MVDDGKEEPQRVVHMTGWRTTRNKEIGAGGVRSWRTGQIPLKIPKEWQDVSVDRKKEIQVVWKVSLIFFKSMK